jgi:hypothetical protein
MSEKPDDAGREIKLNVRPALATNVNLKPERSGKDWLERADLSVEFILHRAELAQLLHAPGGNTELLWNDEGEPLLPELAAPLHLSIVVIGTAKIGYHNGSAIEFGTARLKKISLEPIAEWKCTVRAQVRVDPEKHVDLLSRIGQVERKCKLGFSGAVLVHAEPGDEDAPAEDQTQGKLQV